jgi:hypothetical protein
MDNLARAPKDLLLRFVPIVEQSACRATPAPGFAATSSDLTSSKPNDTTPLAK